MSPRTRTRPSPEAARVEVISGDESGRRAAFGREVERGLSFGRKHLPPDAMFDAGGVELLHRLRRASTSYLVEAERQLIADRAYALPLYFAAQAPTVIEIGVPDVRRTEALLAPLLEDRGEIRYTAVGPHRSAVDAPCHALAAALPRLQATAMVGRIEDALRDLRASQAPVLLFWPDAGVADRPRPESLALLRGVAAALRPRDLLMATFDLRKDPRLVQRVYRDRHGVAKQLHLNALQHIDDELGGQFDISLFRHRFAYDEATGELSSQLVSRRAQTVRIAALGLDVEFAKGEAIDTLTKTKFSPQEIDQAAHAAGLAVHERWYDREGRACGNLMRLA